MLGKKCEGKIPRTAGAVAEYFTGSHGGYASMVNWFRSVSEIPYPDFDVIENKDAKRNATVLSLMIDWGIMFGRYKYQSADDLIETIIGIEEEFRKSL